MKKSFKVLSFILIAIMLIILSIKGVNVLTKIKKERIRNEQLNAMINYISAKYNINFTKNDCIYYKTEDYSFHSDIFGNGKNYSIPYVGIFENKDGKITVVNRKNFISDNKQLKVINTYIGNYFKKIIGYEVDFVEIKEVYNGNIKDDLLNNYIQNDFNKFIDEYNIEEFIEGILKKDDLKMIFYIKEQDNIDLLIQEITSRLIYLKDKKNIKSIVFYVYDKNEELITTYYDAKLEDDYYDSYKFGYYSVNNDFEYYYPEKIKVNNFIYRGFFNLDRGYTAPQGEKKTINGWSIYKFK